MKPKNKFVYLLKFIYISLGLFLVVVGISYAVTGVSWPAVSGTSFTALTANELRSWIVIGNTFGNNKDATENTIAHLGNVGIGTNDPKVLLDVNGSMKLGFSATCNADTEGAMRYDSGSKSFEWCNGSSWEVFKSSPNGFIDYSGSSRTRKNCVDLGGKIVAIAGDTNGTEVCQFTAMADTNVACPDSWSKAANWSTTEGCSVSDGNYFKGPKTVYCNVPDGEKSEFCPNNACVAGTNPFIVGYHSWSNTPVETSGATQTQSSASSAQNVSVRWNGLYYETVETCNLSGGNFILNGDPAKLCGYQPKNDTNLGYADGYLTVRARTSQIGCW